MNKEITIALYQRHFISDWHYGLNTQSIAELAEELNTELQSAGVSVRFSLEETISVDIQGYGDILNAVRLRSSEPVTGNPCLGHIIGESKECNLLDDIRRGVSRLAFASETIVPEDAHRKVCHNCGCGC
jgi:hypothetical protein